MRLPPADPAQRTPNQVLAEVAHAPGISRSDVALRLGLNLATVSRVGRDLIEAGLIEETETPPREKARRPGRPFIGLRLRAQGGTIIGIGINAFRQSVTLADLRNEKQEEWVSPYPPGHNGTQFLEECIDRAKVMVDRKGKKSGHFFGVGLAVAANIDRSGGILSDAPTFGWKDPINVRLMVAERLGAPVAIETPSLAMTQAEAEFGQAQDAQTVVTLHCSLGFGIGVRKAADGGPGAVDFGRVLTRAKSATPVPEYLDGLCGGVSVLNELEGPELVKGLSDSARGAMLSAAVSRAGTDPETAALFKQRGRLTGQYFALLLDVIAPDLLILAGPLARADSYVHGVREAMNDAQNVPKITTSEMTPTGASRWLALRACVLQADLDFNQLKGGVAA